MQPMSRSTIGMRIGPPPPGPPPRAGSDPHDQNHRREDTQGEKYDHFDLGVACQDGEGESDSQQRDGGKPVAATKDENDSGELPSRPGHDRRVGEPQIAEEGPAQDPCRSGESAGYGVQPQYPPEEVGTRASDDQRDEDLDPVDDLYRGEVADEGGQAERPRSPIECQGHSEGLEGIPQRQVPMVHLRPSQGDPWHDFVGLVPDGGVVKEYSRSSRQPVFREKVVGPEIGPVYARRHQGEACGHDYPKNADDIPPSGNSPRANGVERRRRRLLIHPQSFR